MGENRFAWTSAIGIAAAVLTLCCAALTAGAALAQGIPPPDSYSPVDANGVNVSSGGYQGPAHTISVGQPDQGGLSVTLRYDSTAGLAIFRHDQGGTLNRDPLVGTGSDHPQYIVSVLGQTAIFMKDANGDFVLFDGTGSLTFDGTSIYTFTALDSTVSLAAAAHSRPLPHPPQAVAATHAASAPARNRRRVGRLIRCRWV